MGSHRNPRRRRQPGPEAQRRKKKKACGVVGMQARILSGPCPKPTPKLMPMRPSRASAAVNIDRSHRPCLLLAPDFLVRHTVPPADSSSLSSEGDARLWLDQNRVLELVATGSPVEEVLAAVCLMIESQDSSLKCSVLRIDAGSSRTRGGVGPSLDPAFVAALCGHDVRKPYVGSCCEALDTGMEVLVEDVEQDTRFSPAWRALNLAYGLRACRSVPVLGQDGEVLASVAIFLEQAGDPGPADARLLGMATHLTRIAIEYHRTQADLRSSLREQRMLALHLKSGERRMRLLWESAGVLLTTDDPQAMLAGVFEKIAPALQLDLYFNYMVDEGGDGLRLASFAGVSDTQASAMRHMAFGQALCGTVAMQRAPIAATFVQLSNDPRAALIKALGVRAYTCNPLVTGDRLIGTLSFGSRTRDHFSTEEEDFLATICRYVSAAYERLHFIARLKEADRRKDEFLATLAHELRNPLAPLRNGLEVLKLIEPGNPATDRARGMMDRQLRQMVRLVDDLLDVSRISSGKIALQRGVFDIALAVRQAVETTAPAMDMQGHVLEIHAPAEPIHVDADLPRISQVIANLLNNAAKYTPAGGRIFVHVERGERDALVRVKDNGVGIAPEMLPLVFDMFTQVNRSLDRSQGGLGIGLSISRALIEMQGGSLQAGSRGLNEGSEFVVRLPLQPAAADAPGDTSPSGTQDDRAALRVLVVDDNVDAAESLAQILELSGHGTRVAHNGLAALDEAASFRPHAAIVDIGMPGIDGYETARRLRAEPWGAAMSLVALSGWGQDEDKARAREAGFDLHLTKPADPAAIDAFLAQLER